MHIACESSMHVFYCKEFISFIKYIIKMKKIIVIGTTGNDMLVVQIPTAWSIEEAKSMLEKALLDFNDSKKDTTEFVSVNTEEELEQKYPTNTSELIMLCEELVRKIGSPIDGAGGLVWQTKAITFMLNQRAFCKKLINAFNNPLSPTEQMYLHDKYLDQLPKILRAMTV